MFSYSAVMWQTSVGIPVDCIVDKYKPLVGLVYANNITSGGDFSVGNRHHDLAGVRLQPFTTCCSLRRVGIGFVCI
jgi:hypothetical protein